MRLLRGFAKRFSATTLKSLGEEGTEYKHDGDRGRCGGLEVPVPACISPTIASSKMTSLKEESRVDIRRAPCNWKLLVNVNRFVLE